MQFRDLGAQYQALKQEIDEGIQAVINSTAFINGKPVTELENKLAEYVGRKHCVACGNGTDALQLALMIWGVGPGDAVFTSDFTYFASAGSSSILGATPVLVDIDLDTFNMSPEALEEQIKRVLAEGKLTPKVVVPVDLFGHSEKELFLAVLDEMSMNPGLGTFKTIDEKIAGMACKASVKGGDRIGFEQAEKLIDELLTLDNPYNCPHGRPTIISKTKTEMEKKFKRIVD